MIFKRLYEFIKRIFTREDLSIDVMMEEIEQIEGKGAQVAWEYMEELSTDFNLYPGDATPAEYLEKMSEEQVKELYMIIKKYKGQK
jgi:hypothetical protein